MFTDWVMIDPHYFYIRGFILGLVVASYFWGVLMPWMKKNSKL